MTARDVNISRQITHVERVIGQVKKFTILGSVIPICIVDLLHEIMISVCGLINLSPSVLNKKKKSYLYIYRFFMKKLFLFLNASFSKQA